MCPDGRPRFILKNPEKAFEINFPEWNVRVTSLVNILLKFQGSSNQEVVKRTAFIVKELTENYAALQTHYKAVYLGWCGNPCSEEAERRYNEATNLICTKELELQQLERTIRARNQKRVMFRKIPSKPDALHHNPSGRNTDEIDSEEKPIEEPNAELQEVLSNLNNPNNKTTYSLELKNVSDQLDNIQTLVARLKI